MANEQQEMLADELRRMAELQEEWHEIQIRIMRTREVIRVLCQQLNLPVPELAQ